MTQIKCSRCGKIVEVDDTLPRLKARCYHCGNTFQISFFEERMSGQSFLRAEKMHLYEEDEEDDEGIEIF